LLLFITVVSCLHYAEHVMYVPVGGVSLLIKLLLLQDTDIDAAAAAVHALSVVTTANDFNCRCVILCCWYFKYCN